MSEFSSERRVVTAAVLDQRRIEMRDLLHQIAGPAGMVKARIRAAAKTLGWSYSRTKDLWYADPRAYVDVPEMLQARATASASVSVPVEVDLERLRCLENEVADLRLLLAETLRRMEGAPSDSAQPLGARPGQEQGHGNDSPRIRHCALAQGA